MIEIMNYQGNVLALNKYAFRSQEHSFGDCLYSEDCNDHKILFMKS
jgi:hypothetical protein